MSAANPKLGDVWASVTSGNILIICQNEENALFGLWLANGNIEKWKFRKTSWSINEIKNNCKYITNISGVAFNESMIEVLQEEGLIKNAS